MLDVKSQMDCRGNLVDILAAGTLGPDGITLDFTVRDGYPAGQAQHEFPLWLFLGIPLVVGPMV